jgi:hypothetical protein
MESVFNIINKDNLWASSVSKSGPGSNLIQTEQIRKEIIRIINTYSINCFFDIPCGDFYWMKTIIDSIPNYIGGDIVYDQVVKNNEKYGKHFIKFDLTMDEIPKNVDLIFCRDCLVHLPLNIIIKALENIKKSNAKYLLMTTFINREFKDIKLGDWRPISFFNSPFNFPKPIELISENCSENFPSYIDKSLGLWNIKQIPEFIPLKIFQFWHTKELPSVIKNAISDIKENNPEFEHFLFDLEQSENFIKEHMPERFLKAYKKIIPLAYKADIWKLCILYIYGGIYLDISFKLINNFKFIELIHKEHFFREVGLIPYDKNKLKGVSNGFMVALPKNPKLLMALNKIVENIELNKYGQNQYDITGATVLGDFFTIQEKTNFNGTRCVTKECNGYMLKNKYIIQRINEYDTSRLNKCDSTDTQAYVIKWNTRSVFNKDA